MPASIGLTHLPTKTKPKHTAEERLRALTHMDEQERRQLAAQWRNTHRPITRSAVRQSADHFDERVGISTAPDLTLRSATASVRRRQEASPDHSARVADDRPGDPPVAFLSPPTIAVRGPLSYMEDPHDVRIKRNDYIVYFRSDVHDEEIARALVQSTSPRRGAKKATTMAGALPPKVSRPQQEGMLRFPTAPAADAFSRSGSGHRSSTETSAGTINEPQVAMELLRQPMAHTQQRVAAPAGTTSLSPRSDANGQSIQDLSTMSIPTILLNRQLPIGSPLWDDDEDNDEDDEDDDDMGFTPSSVRQKHKKRSKPVIPPLLPTATSTGGHRDTNMASTSLASSTIGIAMGSSLRSQQDGLPRGCGSSVGQLFQPALPVFHTGGQKGIGEARAESRSRTDVSQSAHAPPVDHHVDRVRARQCKSRYAPPVINVSELKPKCAVLHVKLEKLSQRMRSEDNEFDEFLKGYLAKLRTR